MMKKTLKIMVTVICFAAICAALLTGCAEQKPEVMEEDATFYINFFKINFLTLPNDEAWKLVTTLLFDEGNTYIKLDKQGQLTLNLKVNESVINLLGAFNLDLSGVAEMDLKGMADIYAAAILPGFALDKGKVRESVELLRSLGAKLDLDYESEEIKKLIASLEETGHVNTDFQIPQQLGVRYEGKYEIRHLPVTDGEKTVVFADEYGENGEPYLLFELTTDQKTKLRTLHLRVDFLELDLYATDKAEAVNPS